MRDAIDWMFRRGVVLTANEMGVSSSLLARAAWKAAGDGRLGKRPVVRWFRCVRDCATPPKIAWSPSGDEEDAVCVFCLKNNRLRR